MYFYNIIKPQMTQKDIARYKQHIDDIQRYYLGKEGSIDYSSVLEFSSDVEDLITNDIEQMIFNKQYLPTMEILEYILLMLNDLDIDDSWGTTWDIAQSVEGSGIKPSNYGERIGKDWGYE